MPKKRKSNLSSSSAKARSNKLLRLSETQCEREERLKIQKERKSNLRANETPEQSEIRLASDRMQHANKRKVESEIAYERRLADDRARHLITYHNASDERRIHRLSRDRQQHTIALNNESDEHRNQRLTHDREHHTLSRSQESIFDRETRLMIDREHHALQRRSESAFKRDESRAAARNRYYRLKKKKEANLMMENERISALRESEFNDRRTERLSLDRQWHTVHRQLESDSEHQQRLNADKNRQTQRRNIRWQSKLNSGFSYDPSINYKQESDVGPMTKVCNYCNALKWVGESVGLCCSSGKIRLTPLLEPPEPLKSLLDGKHVQSKSFLNAVRSYNNAFQMTSFGANIVSEGNFMPTFKIQGQVYHLIGSLFPENLQNMLLQVNPYVHDFKSALESIPLENKDNYQLVINADRKPISDHKGRYNKPSTNEVAVVLVDQECQKRDIVLFLRTGDLQRISETHRSYDALQYPLIFCRGEDGYNFNIFHSGQQAEDTNKKISALQFYCYRLMMRSNEFNNLHRYRQISNQFWVDMYAKIETERLSFIRNSQKQLRAENYIHLQDALRVEKWQKRGLPHAHILLWLEDKVTPNRIDSIIKAEFPNPQEDLDLYNIIKKHMIHGPCGIINSKSPCMKDNRCSKRFPKAFVNETITGEDGYPSYRRRSTEAGGFVAQVKVNGNNIEVDNRWIVPYSPVLSRTFETHLNVEYCSSVQSIKYICKYVNKGSDQATFGLKNENDEITKYQSGRYISTSEATWRIMSFPIHERFPPVVHLDVHLENGQRVYFNTENVIDQITNPKNTTLLAYFQLCREEIFAKTLLYDEVPAYYIFDKQSKVFKRRKRGNPVEGYPGIFKEHVIGRVYTIHPGNTECYFLRLLLHTVRGPTSFKDIRTVNGVVYQSYQAACKALDLIEDDSHWDETLKEACVTDSPFKLRQLFAIIVVFCHPSDPKELWTKYKKYLYEDYGRKLIRSFPDIDLNLHKEELENRCLIDLENTIISIGGKPLDQYGMPIPNINDNFQINREYLAETIRGSGKIALAVASSGISATLLPGGKTAHSMFKIPIDIDRYESPVCNISRNSDKAKVMRDACLIVWDECTMANKKAIEAVDRTLQDLRNNTKRMGGITFLFSGDFRQTLPVITRGTRADEVNASLKRSYLWNNIKKLSLTVNMRVHQGGDPISQKFSNLLLDVGGGNINDENGEVSLPDELCSIVPSIEDLIEKVYPGIRDIKNKEDSWLSERAILCPKNEMVVRINNTIIDKFDANEMVYASINTTINPDDATNYTVDFLNSISVIM
ncbi:uncharacterized protein LOC103575583 [Microplitis demolitor]|uniref:uncharacterized protein LOC103575583 n=1 Tax=Microplitis demolitor TaxID=69319 RepID=UPI00235B5B39|nr:uncharacterized protein LOC103575583 [Microplitis demolitor]